MGWVLAIAASAALATACWSEPGPQPDQPVAQTQTPTEHWAAARARMVDRDLAARGIQDPRVLHAMRRAPRHEMVPVAMRDHAYEDRALPIGHDQTISQPYVVAAMTEAARLSPGERVLEVGTGSGYQAAVLAELGDIEVYSIEIVEPLAVRTAEMLRQLGYTRLHLRIGDGYRGWPDAAPFDAIIVTAAAPEVPKPLIAQLAPGGRLVIPVGDHEQHLRVITKQADGSTTSEDLFEVRFVPMTGEAAREET